MARHSHVLLLRSPSSSDAYTTALQNAGYESCSLSVLTSNFHNLQYLQHYLTRPNLLFAGVIATSARAVEALGEAWSSASGEDWKDQWKELPFYVVGPATAHAVETKLEEASFDIRGKECGTAEALSDYIVGEHEDFPFALPLLFLAGDKRRETLPNRLSGARIPFIEMLAYATKPSPNFSSDLERLLENVSRINYVVFFSPSGCDIALDRLRRMEWFDECVVIAIGPTTGDHLARMGVKNLVIAQEPNPDGILEAIKKSDASEENNS